MENMEKKIHTKKWTKKIKLNIVLHGAKQTGGKKTYKKMNKFITVCIWLL